MIKNSSLLCLFLVSFFSHATEMIMTPSCITRDGQMFIMFDELKRSAPITFVPIFYVDGQPRYGYDTVDVTEEEISRWKQRCNNNKILFAYINDWQSFMPFKTPTKTYRTQFRGDIFHNRNNYTQTAPPEVFRFFSSANRLLKDLAQLENEPVADYLNGTKHFSVNLQLSTFDSEYEHSDDHIIINLRLKGRDYLTVDGSTDKTTLERLIIHELIHTVSSELNECEIIDATNKLLQKLGYPDRPRNPVDG